MGYKAVLLYEDIPIQEWPEGASGAFIYRIVDLPVSNQVPDKRAWRVWTSEQANQYSEELENDFERFDEKFDRMSVDKRIELALRRAEKFGIRIWNKFKVENVKSGLTKSQIRQMVKDFRDVEAMAKGGSLKALLEELSEISNPALPAERVVRYGNEVRAYLGLDPVLTQAELDDGIV